MKTRKSIRAVFALVLAAALMCGSLPSVLAYQSDGSTVSLPDGGTYSLVDYDLADDFDVYYVNSEPPLRTTEKTATTYGVSIRGVRQQISHGTAGYLYIPDTYGGYPVVRMEKPAAGSRYLGICIPATVKEIADTTFSTCPYLEWIEVDDANTSYFSVDGVLYRGNRQRAGLTSLVCYPQGKKDESFTTSPDGDGIADRAFNENPYLKTLTIAVGALGTDVGAICNCTALETLIFGEGQMSLDFFSVTGCSALKTVHFSDWFLNFLDYMNADEMGVGEIADYLDRIGMDDVTVCCAAPSALLEAAAQEAGFGYSVCGDTHTYAQDVPPDAQDPNAPTVSAETAFWFTNYYQRDADGNNVHDENGLPIVIGYAVEGLLTRNVADAARVIIPAYHFGLPVMEIHNIDTAFDNLISVHIPATVESIAPYAFLPGEQITAFTVDEDSPYFKSVDGVLYTADGKTLVAYPQAKADTVFTIPQGTERLADSEYVRLSSNLRELNIPASFTDRQIAKVLRRPGLETIRVDAGNPALFADASGVLYDKDQTALLHYPTYGPQDYTLPESVLSIAENAIGSDAPRTLRIADGVTVTPIGSLSVSANADEPLCLHIPESVTTIRLVVKGNIQICSTTRASQAAAFAAANGLPFYICNEDHSELREATDDDPPAPAQNEESLYDCSFIYEPDETGVERITGACLRGLMQTPDEPFVLTVPDTYCGVPVREVNFTAQWTKEHSAKVTKIELPATVRSVRGVYNRAMLAATVNAFRNLAAVTVDGANPYLCAVDDVLFDKAMTRLILYPAAKPDVSYAIPDGVRDVKENPWEGGYVFGNNPYLQHLTIPASFTCEGKDSYGFSSAYFNALLHLPALQEVTVDPANPAFASDANGVLYNADRTHLFLYPPEATAEVFTIPASVDRILSSYTFRNRTHLRVICVADDATSTPEGNLRTNGVQYVHIPSSVQNVRLQIIGNDFSICSDSTNCAAAAYAQENSIPFALCSDAHADFTPVLPDDPGETQEDLFRFTYITEKDADGVTRNTGVYIRGLKTAPTEMMSLTIPETYFGLPVLQVDFNIWPDAQKEFFTQIELPKTVQSLGNLWGTTKEFTNLRSIAVDAANPYFRSIDGVLFSKDLTTLIWYPAGKTTASYAIPAGVHALGSRGAFADNMYLQHLSLPASFTEFGTVMHDCFSGLRNLQSFSVAAGNPTYSSDENGVLYNADKTTMILYPCANEAEQYTIPASVRRFGFYTPKYYPQNLRVLCIADGVTLVPSLSIPLGDSVQYLHIPSSVQDLSPYYETEKIAKTVTICSDSADSAAALFARVWRYPFEVCTDHSAGTTPVEPAEPIAMTVSGGTARPGEIVQVTVDLTKNTGIVAARLHLTYDPDVLTLTGVQDGGLLDTASFVAGRDLAAVPYTVLWEDALTHTNHTATGTLVTYTFRVAEDAPAGTTPVTLTYDENSTYNVDLQNVACAITNGTVNVTTRMAGDSNGDGVLDLKDVVLMRRFLAGGWSVTVETDNMDVDGDGIVSLKDSTLLSRFLAGGWNVTLK